MTRFLRALLVFVTLSVHALAQRGLSVSATVTPTFCRTSYIQRVFYPNSEGQLVEPIYLNGVRWSTGFQAGGSAQYAWAPGWSVSTGVWFRQLTTRQARFGSEGATTIRNRAVRLPLLLNVQSSPKRLSPLFSLGMLFDVPMSARVIVTRADQPTQRLWLDSEPGPYFHVMVGAGGRYQPGKRYAFVAQPMLTYNLGRFGGIRTHNPSVEVGLQAQVSYVLAR